MFMFGEQYHFNLCTDLKICCKWLNKCSSLNFEKFENFHFFEDDFFTDQVENSPRNLVLYVPLDLNNGSMKEKLRIFTRR